VHRIKNIRRGQSPLEADRNLVDQEGLEPSTN